MCAPSAPASLSASGGLDALFFASIAKHTEENFHEYLLHWSQNLLGSIMTYVASQICCYSLVRTNQQFESALFSV